MFVCYLSARTVTQNNETPSTERDCAVDASTVNVELAPRRATELFLLISLRAELTLV